MKKSWIFIVVLLTCLSVSSYAQSASELFQQANDFRVSGDVDQALELYQRVKVLDPDYLDDCNYWINHIKHLQKTQKVLELSTNRINIPYQGGVYEVSVFETQAWSASCLEEWIYLSRKGKVLSVSCEFANDSTEPRTAIIEIRSGSSVKRVIVHQDGAPEYLYPSSSVLNFPAKGGEESIDVRTNAFWTVTSAPSWCTVERYNNRLNISADTNNLSESRPGEIKMTSSNGQIVSVHIVQNAGLESMLFSKNQLHFSEYGGEDTLKVHTEIKDWYVADFPHWCKADKLNDTTIVIRCTQNEPTGFSREGGINISTGHRVHSLLVCQQLRPKPEYVPITNILGGRDVSLGLSVGYLMPIISAKSSSNYTCSAVNYGLGDSKEQVAYSSKGGFSAGAFVDVRLFKNLYMIAGMNYTSYSYTNLFDEIYERRINVLGRKLYGLTDNKYEEKYKLSYVDVPLLLSYRFPLTYMSHVRVNAGPILSVGLSGGMDIDGITEAPHMQEEGTIWETPWSYSCSGRLNLFETYARYTELHTAEGVSEIPVDYSLDMSITDTPFRRFNAGAVIGIAYEIRGVAIGIEYYAMLSNIANEGYWESERMEIFQYKSGVLMSGYTQKNHRIQINLSYTFRYNKK